MATMQHVYVTAHGHFTPTVWAGESAQIGIRLAMAEEAAEPARGTLFTMEPNGDVVADSGVQAGTNGTLSRTWKARIGGTGSLENADAAWQVDVAEDMRAFLLSVASYQSAVFSWTHIKVAPITASGAYGAPSAVYQLTAPIVGARAVAVDRRPFPPEVALALSLRAGVLGRRGRGRMYLPGFPVEPNTVDADGAVASNLSTALLGYAQTLIAALENAPGTEERGPLVVVTSAGKPDAIRPVQVRVGSHWDVQRRRQAQATETYASAAIT